jgi:hypothetical protein
MYVLRSWMVLAEHYSSYSAPGCLNRGHPVLRARAIKVRPCLLHSARSATRANWERPCWYCQDQGCYRRAPASSLVHIHSESMRPIRVFIGTSLAAQRCGTVLPPILPTRSAFGLTLGVSVRRHFPDNISSHENHEKRWELVGWVSWLLHKPKSVKWDRQWLDL